jgi:hypothetical protein
MTTILGKKLPTREPDAYFYSYAEDGAGFRLNGEVLNWHSDIHFALSGRVYGSISGVFGKSPEEVLRPLDDLVQRLAEAYRHDKRTSSDDLDWWSRDVDLRTKIKET